MSVATPVLKEDTAVTTAWTTVYETGVVGGYQQFLAFQIDNAAALSALSDFKVQVKDHADASWEDYIYGAMWSDGSNTNLRSESATRLNAVASGSTARATVRFEGVWGVRLLAKSASTSTVTIRGTLS